MNWVDAAVLFILILSALFSVVRGFVREVLGVVAWVGAAWLAWKFYPLLVPEVASVLPMKNFVNGTAAGVVFVIVLVVLSLLSALIGDVVRNSPVAGVDSSLGLLFGLARGALVVCVAYIALTVGVQASEWPAPVKNARCLPLVREGADALITLLPAKYRPALSAPAGTVPLPPVSGSNLQME